MTVFMTAEQFAKREEAFGVLKRGMRITNTGGNREWIVCSAGSKGNYPHTPTFLLVCLSSGDHYFNATDLETLASQMNNCKYETFKVKR